MAARLLFVPGFMQRGEAWRGVAELLPERFNVVRFERGRGNAEVTDPRNSRGLLRVSRERPGKSEPGGKTNEFPPPHSAPLKARDTRYHPNPSNSILIDRPRKDARPRCSVNFP